MRNEIEMHASEGIQLLQDEGYFEATAQLSRLELTEKVKCIFQVLDAKSNSDVEFKEFMKGIYMLGERENELLEEFSKAELRDVFEAIDIDDHGYIDEQDWLDFFFCEARTPTPILCSEVHRCHSWWS